MGVFLLFPREPIPVFFQQGLAPESVITLCHKTGQVEKSPYANHQASYPDLIPEEKKGRAKKTDPVRCFTATRFDDKPFQGIRVQGGQRSFGDSPFEPRGRVRKPVFPGFDLKMCFINLSVFLPRPCPEQPTRPVKNLRFALCHPVRNPHVDDQPRKDIDQDGPEGAQNDKSHRDSFLPFHMNRRPVTR